MADQVDISGGHPGPTSEPVESGSPHQFGLTAAMALIVGSIIGVGIFNLPTSLAFYGPISAAVLTVAIVAAGGVLLTFVFTTLIHGPASMVTLAAILVLSAGLDFGWKRVRSGRTAQVQVGTRS